MLSHHCYWTTCILLLFFTIACQGYNYGNDTSVQNFDDPRLGVRATGPGSGTGHLVPHELRIVAVGDVHGDFGGFLAILKYLEVVDQDGNWPGKVDVFVQLGDLMDRGPDTIKNHEVKNLMYHWDYVSAQELKTFGFMFHEKNRRQELSSRAIGKSLANNYLGALLLPLYPDKAVNAPYDPDKETESQFSHSAIAFVHAGLDPWSYEKLLPFPTKINSVAKELVERLQHFLLENTKKLRFEEKDLTPEQKLLCGGQGPLWYRGLAGNPNCPEVEKMLKKIGARKIVVGHTPKNGIVAKCNGKIIVIDTGITRWEHVRSDFSTSKKSTWVEGDSERLSALNIQYIFDGKIQREVIHAVYPGLEKPYDSKKLADVLF